WRKAKTIAANNSAGMHCAISSYFAFVINFNAGKKRCIITNLTVISNINLGIYFYVVSDLHIAPYVRKSTYVAIFSKSSAGSYETGLFNSCFCSLDLGIHFHQFGKRLIGVFNAYESNARLNGFFKMKIFV